MKLLLLVLLASITITAAQAQFHYDFSTKKEAYVPLTNGNSLVDTNTWDDENIKIPIGFSFKLNGKQLDSFALSAMQMLGDDTIDVNGTMGPTKRFSGFIFMNADIHDRADTGSATKGGSPVRYALTGIVPDRIFKFELFNAGFVDEYDDHGTSNDSLNMQIWIYEKGNVLEFRFGQHYMNHDYFQMGGFVPFLYIDKMNENGTFTEMYYLYGNPASADIDSTDDFQNLSVLDSYPDSGTVFRFTPKPVSIYEIVNESRVKVYPTVSNSWIFIKNDEAQDITYKVVALNGAGAGLLTGTLKGAGMTPLNVSTLPAGNYVIYMNSNAGKSSVQFIKL